MGLYIVYAVIAVLAVGFSIYRMRKVTQEHGGLVLLDQLLDRLLREGPLTSQEKAAASAALDPIERGYEAGYPDGYPPEVRLHLLLARSKLALIDPENHGGWPMRMRGREGLVAAITAHPGLQDPRQAFSFVMPALIGGAPDLATRIFHQLQQHEPHLANAVYGWVQAGVTKYPELNPPHALSPWLTQISG